MECHVKRKARLDERQTHCLGVFPESYTVSASHPIWAERETRRIVTEEAEMVVVGTNGHYAVERGRI